MPLALASYDLMEHGGLDALASSEPERLRYRPEGGAYLNLTGLALEPLAGIDEEKIAKLCRVVRGLLFAAVDGAKSGHPGGSSSKAEQVLTLLASGTLAFDARWPKHPGRDRVVWSAGHCTPLFHALVALVYDTLRSRARHCRRRPYRPRSFRSNWRASAASMGRAATWNRAMRWPTPRPALPGTDSRRVWDLPCCNVPAVCRRGSS